MSVELWQLSAAAMAARIRSGDITARQVVEAHLERMAAVNPGLNAVTVDLGESALVDADKADAMVARGDSLGPLHGVPVTIKENVDQAGQATTNGVAAFADLMAAEDSPVVANLRRAGAVIIGRTNTPEFSLRWFTDNTLRGLTKNPWNESITCGGSSGGAAASLAMGIGAIAHGNDLGGSLRYPAYCCGLATIRPSLGRVPAFNASGPERPPATTLMSVQGPLAREVGDVRLALAAMAAGDSRDPLWKPVPLSADRSPQPLRVAVCDDPAGTGVHPEVAAAVDKAASILADAGHELECVRPPDIGQIAATWGALLCAEIRTMLQPLIREHGSADINRVVGWFLNHYQHLDLPGYMRALCDRMRLTRRWLQFLDRYALVVVPVSQEPPMLTNDDLRGPDRVAEIVDAHAMMLSVNLLGLPAAMVPTGLADGVPIGVQIIAPRYREDLCLDAAETVERHVGVLTRRLWTVATCADALRPDAG